MTAMNPQTVSQPPLPGPLYLKFLGGFEVVLPDHRIVKITTKKNRALLAYLAIEPGRPRSREQVLDLLWRDSERGNARDSLRQSLVVLRRDLAGVDPMPLTIEGEMLRLDPATVEVDVAVFARLSGSTEVHDLGRAAELYRGDFMDGIAVRDQAFEDWLFRERRRLHDVVIGVLERLVPLLSGSDAVDAARRLVTLDPLSESSNLTLIRLYANQGEIDLAARQARDFRALLARELQTSPSSEVVKEIDAIIRDAVTRPPASPGAVSAAGPAADAKQKADPAPAVGAAEAVTLPASKPDPDRIVIAALPFAMRSSGVDFPHYGDVLTDNIVTALSRTSMFRVAARSSTQVVMDRTGDTRDIAAELGADYVLEGGMHKAGDQIRLNVRLVDADLGHHIWADRYDCSTADLADIEDTLARSVAASIATQIFLDLGGTRRARQWTVHGVEPTTRDLIMRSRGVLYELTPTAFVEACTLARQVIAREPGNAAAHLVLAEAHLHQLSMGLIPHDEANVALGLELAQKALELNLDDEWACSFMANALSEANRLEEAVKAAERALEINPSFLAAIARLGELQALLGQPEAAIENCRLALKLNPRNPANFWRHSSIALAHFVAGNYELMLQEARRVQAWRSDFLRGPILVAVALAALERSAEVAEAVAVALDHWPALTVDTVVPRFLPRFARVSDHDRLLDLLGKAGLPR